MDIFHSLEETRMMGSYTPVTATQAANISETIHSLILKSLLVITFAFILAIQAMAGVNSIANNPLDKAFSEIGVAQQQQRQLLLKALRAYDEKDYALSYRIAKSLADAGVKGALNLLAMHYDSGSGVAMDNFKAYRWYKKAATAGDIDAQHNLAVAYAKGQGVKKDLVQALQWWRVAAMGGNTDAQYNLGIIYATGKDSVEVNIKKALKWWRKAAISGDALAQFNLGALYANGIGMSSRTCEAFRWWKKSAENGFEQAQLAIAFIVKRQDYHICR